MSSTEGLQRGMEVLNTAAWILLGKFHRTALVGGLANDIEDTAVHPFCPSSSAVNSSFLLKLEGSHGKVRLPQRIRNVPSLGDSMRWRIRTLRCDRR